jgi:hypothetical protein
MHVSDEVISQVSLSKDLRSEEDLLPEADTPSLEFFELSLSLARQVLYHLSHIPQPFFFFLLYF